MTYRSDHDAALARIDALERELAEREVQATAQVVTQPARKPWWLIWAVAAALASGVFGGVAVGVMKDADATQHVKRSDVPAHRELLARCADAIQPGAGLDAERTDPRAEALSIAPIARSGAACRGELHGLVEDVGLDEAERDALWKWVVAEDELAGAISRIEVYYGSDPYKLDEYATARQLWSEYDRAHQVRNRALQTWRVQFVGG